MEHLPVLWEKIEMIKPYKFENIYSDGKNLLTKGRPVSSEKTINEYRLWNPRRSKLCAMLLNKCKTMPIKKNSRVLYLGAASGTTSSYVSDIADNGVVYCVEFSPRVFRELIFMCEKRKNTIPILADANKPEKYRHIVENVDVIYQDIAQRNQTEIFKKNIGVFLKKNGYGIIMVKAGSIDTTAKIKDIYNHVINELKSFEIVEKIELKPYCKDHLAICVKGG
ncbi:MAG: fibrillarin-like rRNA/tRNA 2'-O-methyltransferase [Thermoplasmatales archaeon]|nr:fibrillarin-like rRNA/tRNA 2'-O-methyltransferase [Thermoplasmatales archaeon]